MGRYGLREELESALRILRPALGLGEPLELLFALERELRRRPARPLAGALCRARERLGEPAALARELALEPDLEAALVSAACALPSPAASPVGTLDEAVDRLGTHTALALALARAARGRLYRTDRFRVQVDALWHHALCAGAAARVLAAELGLHPGDALVAGLLHDLGRAVVLVMVEDLARSRARLRQVLDRNSDRLEPIADALHAPVGAQVALAWGLDPDWVWAIARHHAPEGAPRAAGQARLLQLADRVSHAVLGGSDSITIEHAEGLGLVSGTLPELRAETIELFSALQKGL